MPDKLRDSTLQNLQIFMDEDQKKEVSQNYTQKDDSWVLNDDISKETRENLNEDFSKAMMMVSAFSEDSEQGQINGCTDGSSRRNRSTDSTGADAGRSSTADHESGE